MRIVVFLLAALVGHAVGTDWKKLCAMFDHEFDNYDQLEDLHCGAPWGGCLNESHKPLHSIFKRVDDKANLTGVLQGDGCVLYVEQFQAQDPANVYRQKLYVISPDFSMSLWGFANPGAVLGAYKNPALLDGLAYPQVYDLRGCEVQWHWDGPSKMFKGQTDRTSCSLNVNGTKHTITDDNTLSDNFVTIHEHWNPPLPGTNRKLPEILYKWRTATQAHYRGFFYAVNPANTSQSVTVGNVSLFNVGQVKEIVVGDMSWYLELAVCHYNADHTGAEVLKLAVYRKGFGEAMTYTWAHPGAPSLGLTYRDITASQVIVQTEFNYVDSESAARGEHAFMI